MIHELSGRRGSYGGVDCGAVPETLFESTFFGHKTGPDARRGEILRADGGTLFLDEVANMSLTAQAKLLRVIEDGKVVPLGSSDGTSVDVRWIAATNRDLFTDGAGFRPDLLRRLAGYVARIPPLRQRREDLGVLAAHLLTDVGAKKASITAPAGRKLFASNMPGNVRQLRTVLRAAAILAGDAAIEVAHLGRFDAPKEGRTELQPLDVDEVEAKKASKAPEPAELDAALTQVGGNVVQAARLLGTHPRQLSRWIEKHQMSLEKYRG
jgi:DNA-binding NtrC family response regulator